MRPLKKLYFCVKTQVAQKNVSESYNPLLRIGLLFRKIKLIRRIGRRRKAEKAALRHAARLRELSVKQWQKQRRRRLIRFVIRRTIHQLFQEKPGKPPIKKTDNIVPKEPHPYTQWARRKRIIRFLWRRFYHNLRYGENKKPSHGKIFWKTIGLAGKLSIVFNSLSASLIAYFFISFSGQIINYFLAPTFGYTAALRYYRVIYFITPRDYTPDAVKTLFSIEPFTALALGTISLIIYLYVRRFEGVLKQVFLWAYFWGMILFFGALAVGNILTKGFGHVLTYLYLMDTAKLILTMSALGVLLLVGTFSRMLFLSQANCYFGELNHYMVNRFVRYQVVLPFVLSILVIVIFKLPRVQYYEAFTLLSGFIFILPVWQTPLTGPELLFEDHGKLYLRRRMLLISLFIWVLYRMFTDPTLLGL